MHIVKRGINHQDIFIDKSDYEFFLKLLSELKGEMGFDIIAYCLMSNHFHLLLHDGNAQFSKIRVIIPCFEEQLLLSSLFGDLRRRTSLARQELEKWEKYKDGLMQKIV